MPFSGWSKAKSALETASGVSGWWLHEPNYIEWSSEEPVFAAEILEQLTEGLADRGIRKVFVLEAAAALLPHLPKVDGTLLKNSMRKLLKADQALREDTHLLPKRVRKLIEQLKGATARR